MSDTEKHFFKMAAASASRHEDFNDFADDRALMWAAKELNRLRAKLDSLTSLADAGSVHNMMNCADDTKRMLFGLLITESAERKRMLDENDRLRALVAKLGAENATMSGAIRSVLSKQPNMATRVCEVCEELRAAVRSKDDE